MTTITHPLTMISKTCRYCYKTFYYYPDVPERTFCTTRCQDEYDTEKYGEYNQAHVSYKRNANWAIARTTIDYEGMIET